MKQGKESMIVYARKLTRKAILKIGGFSLILIALDRLTKIIAQNVLQEEYTSISVLPVFNFTLVFNRGVSFSFLYGLNWLVIFLLSTCALLLALVILYKTFDKIRNREIIILSLLIGGSLGNIIDRFVYQYVIDFFHIYYGIWHFPVFNLADCFITLCAILLIYNMFFNKK